MSDLKDTSLFPMVWPSKFKLGDWWDLVIRKLDEAAGYTSPEERKAEVSTDVDKIHRYLHELVHVVQWFIGVYGKGSDDAGYEDLIASVIKSILIDNAKLFIDMIISLVGRSQDIDIFVDLLKHIVSRVREIGLNLNLPMGLFSERACTSCDSDCGK